MISPLERQPAQSASSRYVWLAAALLVCILGIAAGPLVARAQAPGGLAVTPTRIVFEARTRSAEAIVTNRGTAPATYRISFKNMRMLENGSYEDIEDEEAGERFADKMIRYSPRQVVLQPGTAQTVRLLVRKPRDLAPGEYRSHLLFQVIPPPSAGTDIEVLNLKEGEIRVQVQVIYGISIPVIVRHGDLSATVTLSDLALNSSENPGIPPVLSLRFNRRGDRSVYGDVVVTFKPDGGEDTEVGVVRGVAVFTPNLTRTLRISLRLPNGVTLRGGRLHVVYREQPDEGGAVLAEADIPVP